ncbi:tetraspanin 35 [Megalops cyprinoides]|uniref:tetraspanin 35 n=1 Tax=Megalops cyprinoides TaxID=118141 RepID=UPI0018641057|nr:tetraspanin 35 [Megalops cyprinoides]
MGCFTFLKVMMFIFNGIIFLAGGAILGVGVWVKVDSGSLLGFLNGIQGAPVDLSQLLNVGYLLITVGGVLMVMGFLGCCGAMRESRCMLLLFFVILLIIFIAEVAGAIVVLVFQPLVENLINKLGDKAVKSIKKSYGDNADFTGVWNTTMTGLQCCGFNNYTDFTDSPFHKNNNKYPAPCCKFSSCTSEAARNSTVAGCFPRLVDLIEENAVVLGGVGLGITGLEISAMVVSMILYCKIRSK